MLVQKFAGFWMAFSLLAGSALAGPSCPPAPIKIAYFEIGVFYKSTRGTSTGTGIDRDLMDELSKRSACLFDGKVVPRARLWIELRAGRIAMTPSGVRTPEREAHFWFLPYKRTHQVVLLGPGAPSSLATVADFQGAEHLKFGVVRGYVHSPFFEPLIARWRQEARVVEYVDESLLISAMRRGEVAAMVSSAGAYRLDLATEADMRGIRIADWDPDRIAVVGNLVLSKARFDEAEADKWAQLLTDMQRDGTLLKIFRKYVNAEEATSMLP